MKLIENAADVKGMLKSWNGNENLTGYPFVVNSHAPFSQLHRSLPMLNLGLISSAGAYINGTDAFNIEDKNGDAEFREFPIEIEAQDLLFAAKGYDPTAVKEDRNVLVPIDRLLEYEANGVIGSLNNVWWSLSSYIPNATDVAEKLAPAIVERLKHYDVKAALFVPATRLCHQTLGIIARAVEMAGIPTMMIAVDRAIAEKVRAPRVAYYQGEIGSTVGKANWKQYQLRVLDEAIRWIETFDQPGSRKLVVELENATEAARGER
jgi:D-proline reductase (dithiol) PrdB